MPRQSFRLFRPDAIGSPVVVASPHSGRNYDWDFMSATVLDGDRIRSSEDAFVDLLLEDMPSLGLPLLVAEMPRAFLDLNRATEELDPAVVRDVPRGSVANPRITSGLGVIPRVVAQGRAIYDGKISRSEARDRIERFWHPYHAQLAALMDEAQARFGEAVLIDCHSMPHEAIEASAPAGRTPEIVLGDRFGAGARPDLMDALETIFTDQGFRVARNAPFAGAYVVQNYGKPARGRHAIQIEIDRALYMDEAAMRQTAGFDDLKRALTDAFARFAEVARGKDRVAAE
ncbi:N-formylglutamate amidohydrolase [Jannaschia sp. KMU-145]|uniref:N-formylglutamate amidohydrolase n=1 Tax=Jannaschia halovivens TaxID=3388667 RepID=UPI00396B257D